MPIESHRGSVIELEKSWDDSKVRKGEELANGVKLINQQILLLTVQFQ